MRWRWRRVMRRERMQLVRGMRFWPELASMLELVWGWIRAGGKQGVRERQLRGRVMRMMLGSSNPLHSRHPRSQELLLLLQQPQKLELLV